MKEKLGKNTKIIILVVCIMLTIIGVAYSYLAPLISGVETESTISFNSGMIKITYQGSNVITGENIIPGWNETKEFTVVGSNNTSVTQEDIMDYVIKLVVEENTFSDGAIRFELTGTSSNDADTLSPLFGKVPTGTGETLLGTARFNQDDNIKKDVTHTYSLKIGFPNDPSKNQSNDWGKTFSGYVVVEEGSLQDNTMLATDYIEKVYNDSLNGMNYLRYDETEDNNLRYYGGTGDTTDTIHNFISFNNELWRIIGVFDTLNADTGEKEKSLKIIRSSALGVESTAENTNTVSSYHYSWDSSDISINEGCGINEWSQADLMNELNGDYLNPELEEDTEWYTEVENETTKYDKNQSISYEYQQYIMNARWYLGGCSLMRYDDSIESWLFGTDIEFYNCERSTNVLQNATDGVERTITWDGKVALMYPSDVLYSKGQDGSWITVQLYDYLAGGEWLLTPAYFVRTDNNSEEDKYYNSSVNHFDYSVNNIVYFDNYGIKYTGNGSPIRPTLYLKSNTIITGGTGTSDNPYIIG